MLTVFHRSGLVIGRSRRSWVLCRPVWTAPCYSRAAAKAEAGQEAVQDAELKRLVAQSRRIQEERSRRREWTPEGREEETAAGSILASPAARIEHLARRAANKPAGS